MNDIATFLPLNALDESTKIVNEYDFFKAETHSFQLPFSVLEYNVVSNIKDI